MLFFGRVQTYLLCNSDLGSGMVGSGFFDMVLDKNLVCGLKESSDCKLQEFIIFSGLQKCSKTEILWEN